MKQSLIILALVASASTAFANAKTPNCNMQGQSMILEPTAVKPIAANHGKVTNDQNADRIQRDSKRSTRQ